VTTFSFGNYSPGVESTVFSSPIASTAFGRPLLPISRQAFGGVLDREASNTLYRKWHNDSPPCMPFSLMQPLSPSPLRLVMADFHYDPHSQLLMGPNGPVMDTPSTADTPFTNLPQDAPNPSTDCSVTTISNPTGGDGCQDDIEIEFTDCDDND
jgi:hypothetical protein